MKEWMKRICPCFTPSRIALTESARETSLPRLGTLSTFNYIFFSLEQETVQHLRYMIWLIFT